MFGKILSDDVRTGRTPKGRTVAAKTPWVITDDRWSRDLAKSHFHNVLKVRAARAADRAGLRPAGIRQA